MNKLAAWIVAFFVLMALSTVSVSAATPSVSNARILSTDPLNQTIADLTCLWDYSDPDLDADQSSMKWFVNSTVREIGGPVVRIGGFENGEGWYIGRDFKNRTLDTFVKTEGNSSIQFIFNNSFDTSLHAEHGITTSLFLVPTNISDEAVYSVDFYVEDPSVIIAIQIRFGNDSVFIWGVWYEGPPLQSGWNRLYFFGRDRFPEGPEIELTETNLDRYSLLIENDNSDFQQVVRFDNLLQYVDPVLDSSQTTTGDEVVCEVTPFDGTDTGTAINSSVFTVLPTLPCSELMDGQVLTESIVLPGDCVYSLPHGIQIGADNVELDCNGGMINGSGLESASGVIAWNLDNVTVRNCTVQNFHNGVGISFDGMTNSSLLHSTVRNAGNGILANGSIMGRNNLVAFNRVEDAGGIFFAMNDSRLLNNTIIYTQPHDGWAVHAEGSNNLIAGNAIIAQPLGEEWHFQGGLLLAIEVDAYNNTIVDNEFHNVWVDIHQDYPEGSPVRAYDTVFMGNLLNNTALGNFGINTTFCRDGVFNSFIGESGITTQTQIDFSPTCVWNVPLGIQIAASDIDFDCHGALINGSGEAFPQDVWSTGVRAYWRDNITVQNCTIEGFDTGIAFESMVDSFLLHNTVRNVYLGILMNGSLQWGRNNLVAFNRVEDAGGIFFAMNDSRLLNNTIVYTQPYDGWGIHAEGSNNLIKGNVIIAPPLGEGPNPLGGLLLGIDYDAHNNTILENEFHNSAVSIHQDYPEGSLVRVYDTVFLGNLLNNPPWMENLGINTVFLDNFFNNTMIFNEAVNTTFCREGVFNSFIGWSGIGTRTWFDIDPSCVWNVPGGIAMWETSDLDFDCHGALINGSNLEWGGGFQVQWSRNITIENCRIRNYGAPPDTCCSFGAAAFDSENITFRNLDIADSQFGFFGGGNRRLVEEESAISGVEVGIGHWESEETNISRNTVSGVPSVEITTLETDKVAYRLTDTGEVTLTVSNTGGIVVNDLTVSTQITDASGSVVFSATESIAELVIDHTFTYSGIAFSSGGTHALESVVSSAGGFEFDRETRTFNVGLPVIESFTPQFVVYKPFSTEWLTVKARNFDDINHTVYAEFTVTDPDGGVTYFTSAPVTIPPNNADNLRFDYTDSGITGTYTADVVLKESGTGIVLDTSQTTFIVSEAEVSGLVTDRAVYEALEQVAITGTVKGKDVEVVLNYIVKDSTGTIVDESPDFVVTATPAGTDVPYSFVLPGQPNLGQWTVEARLSQAGVELHSRTTAFSVTSYDASAIIGPAGGTLVNPAGTMKVIILAGALAADTLIEITHNTAKDGYTVVSGPQSAYGFSYDLFPKGAVFAQPVTIVMAYDETQIIGNENNVDIGLWKKNKWVKQGATLDTALNTLTLDVMEFLASAP